MKRSGKNRGEKGVFISQGPTLYEVEYLKQLRKELDTFICSRGFTTVQKVDICFSGTNYRARMQVVR